MTDGQRVDRECEADAQFLYESARKQLVEEAQVYNEAVASFNRHLDNHRDRRSLHDLPYRQPILGGKVDGDSFAWSKADLESFLSFLIDQAHLDSAVRLHPRVHTIHLDAIGYLIQTRRQVITTLEEMIRLHSELAMG